MFQYDGGQGQEIPAGFYVDPDVLLRFGLKSKGPQTNPNALNADAPWVFAPLALAMNNAPSRTVAIRVRDSRIFRPGKLYYIEAIDCVGFLSKDSIGHLNPDLSGRNLEFIMLRKVVRRPISAMLQPEPVLGTQHELLNLAMCYLVDPPGDEDVTPQQFAQESGLSGGPYTNMRQVMLAKGQSLANFMQADHGQSSGASYQGQHHPPEAGANPGVRMVMFRYLPTILDVVLEIEANPSLQSNNANVPAANTQAATSKAGRPNAALINGNVALVSGFTRTENQQFYDMGYPILPDILALNPQQPEKTDPIFPSGALAYGSAGGGSSSVNPIDKHAYWEAGSQPPAPLTWVATPFAAQSLANPGQNISMSQLLANKLAGADLSMKYLPKASQAEGALPNILGIPQLYYFDGSLFHLFSPGVDPRSYFEGIGGGQLALKLAVGSCRRPHRRTSVLSAFPAMMANACYKIPGVAGTFRVPFGHFAVVQTPQTDLIDVSWVRVQSTQNPLFGGTISIAAGALPGSFVITPGPNTVLSLEDGTATGQVVSFVNSSLRQPNLFFVTPFAEPTIERMLNFPLPVIVGGQVTQEQMNSAKDTLRGQPSMRPEAVLHPETTGASRGGGISPIPGVPGGISGSDLSDAFQPEAPAIQTAGGGRQPGRWRNLLQAGDRPSGWRRVQVRRVPQVRQHRLWRGRRFRAKLTPTGGGPPGFGHLPRQLAGDGPHQDLPGLQAPDHRHTGLRRQPDGQCGLQPDRLRHRGGRPELIPAAADHQRTRGCRRGRGVGHGHGHDPPRRHRGLGRQLQHGVEWADRAGGPDQVLPGRVIPEPAVDPHRVPAEYAHGRPGHTVRHPGRAKP